MYALFINDLSFLNFYKEKGREITVAYNNKSFLCHHYDKIGPLAYS